jgi:uncharacterized protein (TIGR03435 family)
MPKGCKEASFMIRLICISIFALSSAMLFGQSENAPATRPSFEIADVHNSTHVVSPHMRGGVLRAGLFEIRTATMLDLISYAWTIKAEKLWGGPAWLDFDRFDIRAKPPNTSPENIKLMLRNLLIERFNLRVHLGRKPMHVFLLTVVKGGKPKLGGADGSGPQGCQDDTQNGTASAAAYNFVTCRGRTLDQIAQDLRDLGFGYLSMPVVNQTGIKGTWDFTLIWTSRTSPVASQSDGISLFEAVDKQLGLKLEPGNALVPVLVIDSVNETPTPNSPGVSSAFPLLPSEFEVATIKPSRPDGNKPSSSLQHGRLSAQNVTLRMLVEAAWDNLPDELLADAPKFLDTAHYDIFAKAPLRGPGAEMNEDDLRQMLRNLLSDRFKLRTHMEERPVEGYVLASVQPKMAKGDPSNRTGCREGPRPDGKDPRIKNPLLGRLLTCQNITMAQFAQILPRLAGGYAHVAVLDATGLAGAYDFTLSFSIVGQLRARSPDQPALADSDAPLEPNGAVSLPEAVRHQLGLKLELRKYPMQVLVIDHIEEKPTEN